MHSLIIQIIRTVVPIGVGALVAVLASINIAIPEAIAAETTLAISTLAGSLWYIAVAWLETKFPAFGWLLGVARKPVYEPKHSL